MIVFIRQSSRVIAAHTPLACLPKAFHVAGRFDRPPHRRVSLVVIIIRPVVKRPVMVPVRIRTHIPASIAAMAWLLMGRINIGLVPKVSG
jgi:hypothetical protein